MQAVTNVQTGPVSMAETKPKGRFNSDLTQVWIGVALIAITGFGPVIAGNSYWIHTFQLVNIYIAAAIFQNMLFVDAGQKSFGQGAWRPMSPRSFTVCTAGLSPPRRWAASSPPCSAACCSLCLRCASRASTSASSP